MALIVTEAVNNAIEHGLPHRGGSIHVGLDISDGTITLDITDDGKGLPANFDPGFGQSLGLRISNALAGRSAEPTSELKSLMRISYAVLCLKKKKCVDVTSHSTTRHEHRQQSPNERQKRQLTYT